MAILRSYSPLVEPISIDEAYVDVTGCLRLYGTPRDMAQTIKAHIRRELSLTCSVGVAPNKFLAKIASDLDKPDGLTVIEAEQVDTFIETLPVEKVPGVGQRAREILASLNLRYLGHVRGCSEALLVSKLGKFGHRLMALSHGIDDSPVTSESQPKSMSSEMTLSVDTDDKTVLATHLLAQSQSVARQLRRHHMRARTITLKIKTADFKQYSRSQTLGRPVRDSETIYHTALELLGVFGLRIPVRLIGVGAGGLQPEAMPTQAALFSEVDDTNRQKWEKIDCALDVIDDRYGGGIIRRGTLSPDPKEGRGNVK